MSLLCGPQWRVRDAAGSLLAGVGVGGGDRAGHRPNLRSHMSGHASAFGGDCAQLCRRPRRARRYPRDRATLEVKCWVGNGSPSP